MLDGRGSVAVARVMRWKLMCYRRPNTYLLALLHLSGRLGRRLVRRQHPLQCVQQEGREPDARTCSSYVLNIHHNVCLISNIITYLFCS